MLVDSHQELHVLFRLRMHSVQMRFSREASQLQQGPFHLRKRFETSQPRVPFPWAAAESDLQQDLVHVASAAASADGAGNFNQINPNGRRPFSRNMAPGHFCFVGSAAGRGEVSGIRFTEIHYWRNWLSKSTIATFRFLRFSDRITPVFLANSSRDAH
jgi:hypothetical protein